MHALKRTISFSVGFLKVMVFDPSLNSLTKTLIARALAPLLLARAAPAVIGPYQQTIVSY